MGTQTAPSIASIRCYICGSQIHFGDQECLGCARVVSTPEREALEHRQRARAGGVPQTSQSAPSSAQSAEAPNASTNGSSKLARLAARLALIGLVLSVAFNFGSVLVLGIVIGLLAYWTDVQSLAFLSLCGPFVGVAGGVLGAIALARPLTKPVRNACYQSIAIGVVLFCWELIQIKLWFR